METSSLTHYGVLGMKWGVRRTPEELGHEIKYKDKIDVKTKGGDTISLVKNPDSKFAKFLQRHIKSVAKETSKTAMFSINDPSGKKVGDLQLYKEAEDSINVVWVGVSGKERGKGYATAVMKAAINIAKDTGCSRMTLEVPGNSNDARHIYEKLGFKEVASPDIDPDDIWGGLTNMELKLEPRKIKHSDGSLVEISDELKIDFLEELLSEIDAIDSNGFQKDSTTTDELKHYGVLGMKWGVRKDRKKGSSKKKRKVSKSKDREDVEKLMKKDVRELSDKELSTVLNRLGAEDRYRQMTTAKKTQQQKGNSWVKRTINGALGLASVAASKALYDAGKKWGYDFIKGFERGFDRAAVERAVAEELKRRSRQLTVIHSDELGDRMDELKHYGVLGMKWGVRRYEKRTSRKPRGAYVQRELDEFNAARERYDRAKERKKSAKVSKDKNKAREAKRAMAEQKSKMSYNYNRLTYASSADRGNKLVNEKHQDLGTTALKYGSNLAMIQGFEKVGKFYIKKYAKGNLKEYADAGVNAASRSLTMATIARLVYEGGSIMNYNTMRREDLLKKGHDLR